MHHPPKGGDPSNWRGSGAVTGALDTIWSAERTENIVTLTQHKRRGPPFEPMHWTTAIVPVSGIVDNFGDTVTTVLALPGVSDEVSQQFDQRYVAILLMIKNDSKATLRQIGDALPRKEDNKPTHPNMVKKVIERMVREGMIKDGGEGGRKILQAGRDYLDYAEAAQTACF